MTSLSAFFISRRSRIGRSGFLDVGEDEEELDTSYSYLHRNSHQNSIRRHRSPNHQRTSRRDSHLRHHPSRRAVNSGSETTSLDQSRSQTHPANVTNPQNNARRARIRFIGNERLPSAVLLARERLLQRLRGVSVSENSDASNASNLETVIMREQLAETDPNTEHSLEKSDRPRGLSQAAVNSLQVEIFKKPITNDGVVGGDILPPERDCSICLDSFFDGEKLICLPCGHRFHYNCLCHWLHICGDCPYCRTGINVDSFLN